ncbi:MAG: alcohol dehydrogenase catalytic domain-containing protein [Nitrospinota bacterium]
MPATSLAAVLHGPGDLRLEERAVPRPGPGEVLVEVGACAICGSDLHLLDGRFPRARFPVVPGHEFMGRVIALGPGVEGLSLGMRACVENHVACGECGFCRAGRENLCRAARSIGFNVDGAYARHVVAPAKCVIPLPGAVDDAAGSVMQTLGTGYHAAIHRARLEPGETAVILGMGPVGLCALASARLAGARTIALDAVPERLAAARKMGADEAVNVREEDPLKAVGRLTGGLGADAVLEAVGGAQKETVRQAVKMARRGGRVVVVGHFAGAEEVPLPVMELQDQEKDVLGSRGHPNTFRVCIEHAAAGRLDVRPMITHVLPLAEVERGLKMTRERIGGAIKVVLAPQAGN